MKALLRPMKKTQNTETVTILARTGRDRVKVKLSTGTVFAVDPFRLYQVDRRTERVRAAELAGLPWEGKGRDPLTLPHAETSGGLPLLSDSIGDL